MASIQIPTPAVPRTHPFPVMWVVLCIGVVLAGCSLGCYVMVSARTEACTPYLVGIGERWLEIGAYLPLAGPLLAHLRHIAQPERILLFPGVLVGGIGAVVLWLLMGMAAAWQNAVLFPRALRQLGWSLMVLILYFPLAWHSGEERGYLYHWGAVVPFAITVFLLAWVFRRICLEALGGISHARPHTGPEHNPLARYVVWIASLVAFLIWAGLSQLRHHNFHSQCYDMALMSHILNRFLCGEGLTSSLIVSGGGFLGHHFSPVLYLLVPFYYFNPHPETLLWIQAAAVAFAAVPLFLFGEVLLGSSWAGCAMALVYLFQPGLPWGICSDFHTISLAPLFLFWLAWEGVRGGSRRWWLPLILLLIVQENLFTYSAALGGFLLIREVPWRALLKGRGTAGTWSISNLGIPVALIGSSLVYAVIVFGAIQPWFQTEKELGYGFVRRYQDFLPEGSDPARIGAGALMWEILTHPHTAAALLFGQVRRVVFVVFWGGIGFLPLWNPFSWVLLFPVLENSLSSEELLFIWGGHYIFGPAMVSALAMVASLAMFRRWRVTRVWLPALSWTFLFSAVLWWLSHLVGFNTAPFPAIQFSLPMEPGGTALVLSTGIGTSKCVSAQSHLGPHLIHVDQLFLLPPSIAVPVEGVSPDAPEFERLRPAGGWPDYLIFDRETPNPLAWYNLWFFDRTKTLQWVDWLVQTGLYHKAPGHGTLEIYERSGMQP